MPAAHAQVESQQTPQVLPLRARSVPLVTLREAKAPGPAPASSDLKIEIVVDGGDGPAFADLPYATLVTDKSDADLIWSVPKGTVEHVVGGRCRRECRCDKHQGVSFPSGRPSNGSKSKRRSIRQTRA